MSCIELSGLTKRFGTVVAVDDISLRLEAGKIYGLLGRNGAGKSTLLNIITGRLFPDQGTVAVDGEHHAENDRILGKVYMMSEPTLFPDNMRVQAAFKWTKEFYPTFDMGVAMDLAGRFKLDTRKRVKALSTGYKSIFKLIAALAVNAPYIFFDEPVLGLDANHRELFYRILLERYSQSPSCTVISTHLVEEVSSLLEDVIIISGGKLLYTGSRDELLSRGYAVSGTASAVDEYVKGKHVMGTDAIGGLKTAYIMGKAEGDAQGLEITSLDLQRLFVQMTN